MSTYRLYLGGCQGPLKFSHGHFKNGGVGGGLGGGGMEQKGKRTYGHGQQCGDCEGVV